MKNLSRRSFLQNLSISAGTAAVAATLPSFINIPKINSTNYEGKKLNIALCGLGVYANILAHGLQISQYGRTETKRAIAHVLNEVLINYKYTPLAELNAVLKQYNVLADRGSENSRMFKTNGLSYSKIG